METTFAELNAEKLEKFRKLHFSKALAAQEYNKIIKKKEKFTDDLFPPNNLSIFSGKTEFGSCMNTPLIVNKVRLFDNIQGEKKANCLAQNEDKSQKYIWKRLSEVYKPGEINIMKLPAQIEEDPDILTEDVVQGELGDCYFLSAISALAEIPDRIKQLFPRIDSQIPGVFEILVYLHGEPCNVVVDDYFPFIQIDEQSSPQIAFVGINQRTKNIWPMILEKVWAKLNLTYEDIISGNSGEAFEFLSPAPIETHYHDIQEDSLFDKIKYADEKDYIICTDITMSENTNSQYLARMGLITNHSYTIIDVAEITDNLGKKIRLLKIRNPWGSNEWSGDWSDKSPKWTPEIKKLLNFNDEEDGTFWMCYEDFLRFYTSTHICMIHQNFQFISKRFPYANDQPFNLVKVDVPEDSTGFFVVNQKNARIYKNAKGMDNFENKYCSVIVFKEVEGDYIYIGAQAGRRNRLFVECKDMKKGTYYIAVSFPSHKDSLCDLNKLQSKSSIQESITYRIGLYSPFNKIDIYDLQGNEESQKLNDFLKDVIFDLAKENKNIYYFSDEGEKNSWRSISFEKEAGAYGYICYENNSDGFIYEHLKFTEFVNLNLIPVLEKGEIAALDIANEEAIQNKDQKNAIDILKSQTDLESSIKVINVVPSSEVVSEDNPIEIIVKVAPHCKSLILIEKLDEDSAIDLSSRVAISYPTLALQNKTKFPPKKTRVKYNNKPVEIYEYVIEHNSGVAIYYKNKTTDLKLTCHIKLKELNNLTISKKPEEFTVPSKDKKLDLKEEYTSYDPSVVHFEIADESKEVILSLEPGETKMFEMTSQDLFESYSYISEIDYHVNLSRSQVKQKYGMK